MTITETQDLDYIKGVISTPGMAKLCSSEVADKPLDEVLAMNHVFYAVADGDDKLGFISFNIIHDGVAEIHVALRTMGSKTVEAIRQAIDAIKSHGVKFIFAVYPTGRKSVDSLCDVFGFSRLPQLDYKGASFEVRQLTV